MWSTSSDTRKEATMSKNCNNCKWLFTDYCPLALPFEEFYKTYQPRSLSEMIDRNNVVCDIYQEKGGEQ